MRRRPINLVWCQVHFMWWLMHGLLICFSKFAVRRWRYCMLSESSCYRQWTCPLSRCAFITRICAQSPGIFLFVVQLKAFCMDWHAKVKLYPFIHSYSAPSSSFSLVHACTYLYVCNQYTMQALLCYRMISASSLMSNLCILGCSLSISRKTQGRWLLPGDVSIV